MCLIGDKRKWILKRYFICRLTSLEKVTYGKHSGSLVLNKLNIIQDYPTLVTNPVFLHHVLASTLVFHNLNELPASLGLEPII